MSPISSFRIKGGCASEFGPISDGTPVIGFVDNATIAHGRPEALRFPELWPEAIPKGTKFISQVSGEWRYSERKRDHVLYTDAFGDQLLWTEVGEYPRREINKKVMPLGIPKPGMPPIVSPGPKAGIARVNGTLRDGGGSHPVERTRYVRIAYETENGMLPACPAGCVTILKPAQNVLWNWVNVDIGIKISRILVFASYAAGSEIHVTSLDPGATEWMDLGTDSDTGMFATEIDASGSYQYVYTLVREVDGIVDESGPSPVSQSVSGQSMRNISITPDTDGLLVSMQDTKDWDTSHGPWAIKSGLDEDFSSVSAVVRTIKASSTGMEWILFFEEAHTFFKGETLIMNAALAPDPLVQDNQLSVRCIVMDVPDANTLIVTSSGLTPELSSKIVEGSARMIRVLMVPVLKLEDAGPKGTKVTLPVQHAWNTGDMVAPFNIGDPNTWNGKACAIAVDPDDSKVLYIAGLPVVTFDPLKPLFELPKLVRLVSYFVHRAPVAAPRAGTLVEIPSGGKIYRAPVLSESRRSDGLNIWVLDALLPSIKSGTGGVRWSESSAYIVKRRLWRTGTTGEFRLVAELPMTVLSYRDVLPDSKLGDVIPTFYQNSLGYVVYAPPPPDLHGLRSHNGTWFGISGYTVRAAEPGFPGAWPDIYEWTFPVQPQRIESYNGALIVFCSDAIYRLDGERPEMMVRSVTQATDGCLAADSVAIAGGRIFYVGHRGLMAFDGQTSVPVAPGRIPAAFWRTPSIYTGRQSLEGMTIIPSRWTAGYHRISEHPITIESGMGMSRSVTGPIDGLAAFYTAGKYVAYWRAGSSEFQGNGMVIVDLSDPELPVTMSGLRIRDAFVDDYETPWVLLTAPEEGHRNAFAFAYIKDYDLAPFTSPDRGPGPTCPADFEQLPKEIWVTTIGCHALFRLLHTRIVKGELLSPELDLNTEYTVTVTPPVLEGQLVISGPSNLTVPEQETTYRSMDVLLRGNDVNPYLAEGDYTIRVECNKDRSKFATAIVHVTKDWKVNGVDFNDKGAGGIPATISFVSDVPIEPGSSINKLTVRAHPTVDFGGEITCFVDWNWNNAGYCDVWSRPVQGSLNREIECGISHYVNQTLWWCAQFTDTRAFYETNFGGVKRRHAFYERTLLINGDPRMPDFRPTSCILDSMPGATWHKTSWGDVIVVGGAKDAYTHDPNSNMRPEPGYVNDPGGQTITHKARFRFVDSQVAFGYAMGANDFWIEWSVSGSSVDYADPDKPGLCGWQLRNEGIAAVNKVDFESRRIFKLHDLGEPKIYPIVYEDSSTGEVQIIGGSCYMQPRSTSTRKANVNTSVTTQPSMVWQDNPASDPKEGCGRYAYAYIGGSFSKFFDYGQDSNRVMWCVASTENTQTTGPIFRPQNRVMKAYVPAEWSTNPSLVKFRFDGNQDTSNDAFGPIYYGLDGRMLRRK